MNELKLYMTKLIHFNEKELEVIASIFSEVHIKKNDYFAEEGEFSTKLAFVSNGILRSFFRNKTGNEYNKLFSTPLNFVLAYSSVTSKQRNLINIQCLTDCTLLVADFRQITELYKEYPKFESFARIMAERKYAEREKREIELVTLSAGERYEIFKKEHPNLENHINQYHIASFLGVTPTQLSRIRSKKK